MKKLEEAHERYTAVLKEYLEKPIELLRAAKYAAGNNISSCNIEGCTADNRCNFCKSWTKVWEDIDAFLKDNDDNF